MQLSQNSFELDLDKNISEPTFDLGENFESKFGAKLAGDGVVKFSEQASDESVNINAEAKSFEIAKIYPTSLDNGILAFRIYLKEWLSDDNNLKKFIKIKGVKKL